MLNSRKLDPKEKVFVTYKDNYPARVIAVEKRGRKHYLLLRWDNFGGQIKPEKWVKDTLCKEFIPTGKGTLREQIMREALKVFPNPRSTIKLNWWQKLIVKLQNWWYGKN